MCSKQLNFPIYTINKVDYILWFNLVWKDTQYALVVSLTFAEWKKGNK